MILLEILIFAGHAVGITEDVCQKSGNDFRIRSLHVFGKRSDELWNECQVKKRVRTWLAYHNMCIRLLYDKSLPLLTAAAAKPKTRAKLY